MLKGLVGSWLGAGEERAGRVGWLVRMCVCVCVCRYKGVKHVWGAWFSLVQFSLVRFSLARR